MNPLAYLKALMLGSDTGTNHQPLKRKGTRARNGNPKKKARGVLVNGRPRSMHAKAGGIPPKKGTTIPRSERVGVWSKAGRRIR